MNHMVLRLACLKLACDRRGPVDTLENVLTAAGMMLSWVCTAPDGAETSGVFEEIPVAKLTEEEITKLLSDKSEPERFICKTCVGKFTLAELESHACPGLTPKEPESAKKAKK